MGMNLLRTRRPHWIDTEGTVASVEVHETTRSGDPSTWTVVFTYKVDGHWYSGTYRTFDTFKVGDTLALRYDPADPNRNNLVVKDRLLHVLYWGIAVAIALAILIATWK